MGLFDNILNAVSGSTKNSFFNPDPDSEPLSLDINTTPILEDEVPEAFLEALRAGNVKTQSISLDDDDDDFFINSENFKEDEETEEDLQIKEYIKERNLAFANESFLFSALFNNYTYENAAYDNYDLFNILFSQYNRVLENIDFNPIIYADDEETMTSGAIFELQDFGSTYKNKYANFLRNDIPIKDCEEYITIQVDSNNIEAFMGKYATPIAIINSSEEVTCDDLLKMLNKKSTDIIREKRVQPFFLINMGKILIDVIDEITKIREKLEALNYNKIREDYSDEDVDVFISDLEKFEKNIMVLYIETQLFKIDSSLRQTYNDDYSFGSKYSLIFEEILSQYEDYIDDDDYNL